MPRFVVRYHDTKVRALSGCCVKPFTQGCGECKDFCLRVTTADVDCAETAITQQKKFYSDGDGFTAESAINPASPKEEAQYKDQRWPFLRKEN